MTQHLPVELLRVETSSNGKAEILFQKFSILNVFIGSEVAAVSLHMWHFHVHADRRMCLD